MDNPFYKSTPLYKELLILDLIEKNPNITQRQMSDVLNSSVAMTNNYLNEFEANGLLERKYNSTKDVEYLITTKGKERKKYLQIVYLNESQKMYDHAKQELVKFVHDIKEKGFTKIVLYGAGEVAEIFLHTIKDEVEVLAVIDDDPQKQGLHLAHVKIISLQELKDYPYDAVLISSFGHYKTMLANLNKANVSNHEIVHFF